MAERCDPHNHDWLEGDGEYVCSTCDAIGETCGTCHGAKRVTFNDRGYEYTDHCPAAECYGGIVETNNERGSDEVQ